MKYKIKQTMPAINNNFKSKLLNTGDIVELINDQIIADGNYVVTSIYNDFLNNTDFFEPIKEIELDMKVVSDNFDNIIEKNWRIQFDFYCTEQKAEELKLKIKNYIQDL